MNEIERLEAEVCDYKARHETSLEVIRTREQEVERQRVEIEKLKAELTDAREAMANFCQVAMTAGKERDEAREVAREYKCHPDLIGVLDDKQRWPWLEETT